MLALGKVGQGDGNACGIGERCAGFTAVQPPSAGDGLAGSRGNGEVAFGVDGLLGGEGLTSGVLLGLCAALGRLVGGEGHGGRHHLGQGKLLRNLRAVDRGLAAAGRDLLIGRDADGIGLAALQAEGLCGLIVVFVLCHRGVGTTHVDHGVAALGRLIADLFKVGGCCSVSVVNRHQIAVGVGILSDGQLILQVARRLRRETGRSGGIAVLPIHWIGAEHHAVDLVGLGVHGADVVISAGHVGGDGQGGSPSFQCCRLIHHADAVAGVHRRLRISADRIVLAQEEANLIQLGKAAAGPGQVDITAVHAAGNRRDLGYLHHIVQQHIAALRGGESPYLLFGSGAVGIGIGDSECVGCLGSVFVIGQVGVGPCSLILLLRLVQIIRHQLVSPAARFLINSDGGCLVFGIRHPRLVALTHGVKHDLHDGSIAIGVGTQVELMLRLVAVGLQPCAGACHQLQTAVIGQAAGHQLRVGAHTDVEGLAGFRVVTDRNVVIP